MAPCFRGLLPSACSSTGTDAQRKRIERSFNSKGPSTLSFLIKPIRMISEQPRSPKIFPFFRPMLFSLKSFNGRTKRCTSSFG